MLRLLLIFVTLSSLVAHANNAPSRSNNLLKFIAEHESLRDFALQTVMAKRCSHYLSGSDVSQCQHGVSHMLDILDYDLVVQDQGFVFMAFNQEMKFLIQNPKTLEFLTLLQKRLSRFISGEEKNIPNLWELALSFYTEPLVAARSLAVLFQDTSDAKLHIAYLQVTQFQGNTFTPEIVMRLSQTIDSINLILDNHHERSGELFYPKKVQSKLNQTIYHFYVPYYLALSLKAEGLKREALFAPMMMTLSYEFITAAPDFRYVFKDPTTLDHRIPKESQKLNDIYAGYVGAAIGAGIIPMPLKVVAETFMRSSYFGVGLLLH